MIEYIKYYCELTGEKFEMNFSKPKISIDELNLDIPDLESQSLYSSNAKESLLEKEKFLEKASEEEKKFQNLKDDIYQGELITEEILKKFENDNKINLLSFRDTIGQSILHVAVDAISFSAVDSLIKMNYAKELIDVCDDVGMTPMHIAAINFDLHIYDLLIQLGPNKNIKDKEGKTCIDYLRENDDVEVPKKYLRNE
jgi:ankyrin repeat protein